MIEQGTQSDENILAELAAAARWLAEGRGVALATVVATWGSSPRPVGSHLVAESQGTFLGSVSGGCIESAVVAEARAVIADGQTRHLNFGVSSEQAWSVGLSCGGTIRLFVERLTDAAGPNRLLQAHA